MEDVARHFYAMESRLTAGLSERMLDLARLRAGMRVLDIASGRGEPLLRATERVGPGGHVLGVDLDEQALADTLATAASRGLSNVELRVGSAEDVDERGSDAVTARWGIMYMASPERVLAAVRRALRPEGTFVAAYWAEPERVEWATLPRRVIARYAPLPPVRPRCIATARPSAWAASRGLSSRSRTSRGALNERPPNQPHPAWRLRTTGVRLRPCASRAALYRSR